MKSPLRRLTDEAGSCSNEGEPSRWAESCERPVRPGHPDRRSDTLHTGQQTHQFDSSATGCALLLGTTSTGSGDCRVIVLLGGGGCGWDLTSEQ
jgi:hypothetical protein